MGDMIYLAGGYAVFWLISFAFIYSLVHRQHQLQKEVEMLEQMTRHETDKELD